MCTCLILQSCSPELDATLSGDVMKVGLQTEGVTGCSSWAWALVCMVDSLQDFSTCSVSHPQSVKHLALDLLVFLLSLFKPNFTHNLPSSFLPAEHQAPCPGPAGVSHRTSHQLPTCRASSTSSRTCWCSTRRSSTRDNLTLNVGSPQTMPGSRP